MKNLFFVFLLIFIISCANAHNYIYVPKREVTKEEFNYDYGNCVLDARQEAAQAVGTSRHPNDLGLFDSITWQSVYNDTFNKCMSEKGYNKTKR